MLRRRSLLSRWIDDYGNPSFSRKLSRKGCNIDFWISRETCGYRNVICIGIRSTDIDEQFASIRTTESNYTCTRVNRYVLIKIGNDRRDCYFTIWFLLLPFRQFPNPFSHVRPLRDAYQSIGRESFVHQNPSGEKVWDLVKSFEFSDRTWETSNLIFNLKILISVSNSRLNLDFVRLQSIASCKQTYIFLSSTIFINHISYLPYDYLSNQIRQCSKSDNFTYLRINPYSHRCFTGERVN